MGETKLYNCCSSIGYAAQPPKLTLNETKLQHKWKSPQDDRADI